MMWRDMTDSERAARSAAARALIVAAPLRGVPYPAASPAARSLYNRANYLRRRIRENGVIPPRNVPLRLRDGELELYQGDWRITLAVLEATAI
jgi:hypothetical protein